MNNGVAAHVHNEDHQIDWEGAKVIWSAGILLEEESHRGHHDPPTQPTDHELGLWLELEQTMACIT